MHGEPEHAGIALELGALATSPESDEWEIHGPTLSPGRAAPLLELWSRFRRAVTARSGAIAVDTLSEDSIAFWGDIRHGVLDPELGRRLAVTERLYIELARRFVGPDQVSTVDARGLLVLAVDGGWAVPDEVTGVLARPVVRVTLAAGGARVWHTDGYTDQIRLEFWGERWGVGFSSLLEGLGLRATDDATNAGLSEDEYITAFVDRVAARLGAP